jgi:hypothetical protein
MAVEAGSGRMVLAAFSPERADTDLVLRSSFVPLVNELVNWASHGEESSLEHDSNCIVGERMVLADIRPGREVTAEIARRSDTKPVALTARPGATTLSYRPYYPGNYSAAVTTDGRTERADFSANLDPAEGDPARVSAERIAESIENAVVVTGLGDRRVAEARGRTRGAREIYDLLLVAALVALTVEAYVANRFYREGPSG